MIGNRALFLRIYKRLSPYLHFIPKGARLALLFFLPLPQKEPKKARQKNASARMPAHALACNASGKQALFCPARALVVLNIYSIDELLASNSYTMAADKMKKQQAPAE